jgi:GTPase
LEDADLFEEPLRHILGCLRIAVNPVRLINNPVSSKTREGEGTAAKKPRQMASSAITTPSFCAKILAFLPLSSFLPLYAVQWKIAPAPQFSAVLPRLVNMAQKLPSLVIVGRPNVGKSTLFNRLTGTRRSIVTNEPGITRDRIYGKAEWRGRTLEIVDTGGIIPDDKALIPREILRQAHVAIGKAALLVLVVDGHVGITPLDEELARLLRTSGKPFVIAVNKIDAASQEANAAAFHRIGAPVFPIAAEHGTGVDDLLDYALAELSADGAAEPEKQPDTIEVAIIGRPNVGKSTLLNRLVGEERSIVSPIPGTTMDNVDTEIARNGVHYRFVDTAGIRRKGKTTLVAEKLSVVMARRGLERCDVALLVVDAEQGVTQGDAQIASYAEESGRSVIIVMNKWDLAIAAAQDAAAREAATAKGKSRRVAGEKNEPESFDAGRLIFDYEKMVRAKLKFLSYAPIVFLSAKTGERAEKLFPLIEKCWEARKRKIPTPALNNWLKEDVDLQRGTTPKARPVRIYYITQAKTAPPTFLMFTNQKTPLHFSYERFLENQLRAKFDFAGTPVRFIQRLRKRDAKRDRKSSREAE